jgi:hypothetical protein
VIVKKKLRFPKLAILLFVVLISGESLYQYYKVAKSYRQTGSFYNGSAFLITDEIKQQGMADKPILFLDYHICYWLLDIYPLTKSTTHPSNIRRSFLFKYFGGGNSSIDELKRIMEEIRPEVIVSKTPYLSFFPSNSPEENYFREKLETEFEVMINLPDKKIYAWRRIKN